MLRAPLLSRNEVRRPRAQAPAFGDCEGVSESILQQRHRGSLNRRLRTSVEHATGDRTQQFRESARSIVIERSRVASSGGKPAHRQPATLLLKQTFTGV